MNGILKKVILLCNVVVITEPCIMPLSRYKFTQILQVFSLIRQQYEGQQCKYRSGVPPGIADARQSTKVNFRHLLKIPIMPEYTNQVMQKFQIISLTLFLLLKFCGIFVLSLYKLFLQHFILSKYPIYEWIMYIRRLSYITK